MAPLSPFLLLLVVYETRTCSDGQDDPLLVKDSYFYKTASNVDLYQYDANVTWSGAANPIQCARLNLLHIAQDCCPPKGYVYDATSGLCRPVYWQGEIETNIPKRGYGSSSLYRSGRSGCREGYEEIQYNNGTANITNCVALSTKKVYWVDARKNCLNANSFLASTKSAEKLARLVELAQGQGFWIGLDDIATNLRYVWTEDLTVIDPDLIPQIFKDGQPDNGRNQDCMTVVEGDSKLYDAQCRGTKRLYFCDIRPGC